MTTADLDTSVACWTKGLDLPVVDQGELSETLSEAYGVPTMAGARWALMGGAIGGLRLVEAKDHKLDDMPLASIGWAAAEVSVTDLDAVFDHAIRSGFTALGPPRSLGSNPAIRAAQVVAPGGGVLYLTDIRAYAGPLDLFRAQQLVDRAFIAVLASDDLERDRTWMEHEGIGSIVTDRAVEVPVLQAMLELDQGETTRISSLQLAEGCLIEVDAYPPATSLRPALRGWPVGVAMVTVACPEAPQGAIRIGDAPYFGRAVHVERLPSGALLERVAA